MSCQGCCQCESPDSCDMRSERYGCDMVREASALPGGLAKLLAAMLDAMTLDQRIRVEAALRDAEPEGGL